MIIYPIDNNSNSDLSMMEMKHFGQIFDRSCSSFFHQVASNSQEKERGKKLVVQSQSRVIETIEKLYSTCTSSSFASNKIMTVS